MCAKALLFEQRGLRLLVGVVAAGVGPAGTCVGVSVSAQSKRPAVISSSGSWLQRNQALV